MGTKLIVYVLMFDVLLALALGAYSGITAPTISPVPTPAQAQDVAGSVSWTLAIPQITLIPPFSFLGATFPGLTIPHIVLFSINFEFLWIFFYVGFLIAWIFSTIGSIISWLLQIFAGSISLLSSVYLVGPFISAFVLLINFVLIWELIKLIRGYGP
ncbi:hypothetical protein SMF1_0020 [Sulfolobales Mexican fusellovirus 1]|uniref:hypothetical protein n=1 Tax=Sulfolobales Mexican fusellovirus 1 TaxID=1298531 RepID=UPI0002C10ACA|nr:hypothetical protein SMF1_0020 [Sulfolobales Mexican fusellovirus 1]AGG36567.1 hypothetical protein SMF1_0020 [Sulfolobales Mexican fusellovirus 1]